MCCLFGFTLEYVDKSSESGSCCLYPKVVNVIGLEPQKQAESSDRLDRGVRLCQASSSMTLVLSKMGKEHPFAECSSYRLALGLKKDQRLPWHSQSLVSPFWMPFIKGTRVPQQDHIPTQKRLEGDKPSQTNLLVFARTCTWKGAFWEIFLPFFH